jgi:hypothetical protein
MRQKNKSGSNKKLNKKQASLEWARFLYKLYKKDQKGKPSKVVEEL